MIAFVLPEVAVKVTYLTAEACLLSGLLMARIAESAKSSPTWRAFEVIMNYLAQLYSTRSSMKGDDDHWEKAEGGCHNRTTL